MKTPLLGVIYDSYGNYLCHHVTAVSSLIIITVIIIVIFTTTAIVIYNMHENKVEYSTITEDKARRKVTVSVVSCCVTAGYQNHSCDNLKV
jgi:hypothetical protein